MTFPGFLALFIHQAHNFAITTLNLNNLCLKTFAITKSQDGGKELRMMAIKFFSDILASTDLT